MARDFASIKLAIWNDDDFRDLTPAAQHLYFVLLTERSLSYCGVAGWAPKKLAQKARGWTVAAILDPALELVSNRLLVIAEDTDEYLVRSFVRHDGVMSHPKLCVSAAIATQEIGSNGLRQVVVGELKRLKADRPDLPAWGKDQVIEVVKRKSIDGRTADLFREPFSPGLREAVREAFSLNASSALERPYERPYNSNSNSTTLQRQQSGGSKSVPHQGEIAASETDPQIQACGKAHDPEKSCRPCGEARKQSEAAEVKAKRDSRSTEAKERRRIAFEAISACDFCNAKGYTPGGKPCRHDLDDGGVA